MPKVAVIVAVPAAVPLVAVNALDVFEKEPVSPDNPLLKMDNVVATPHMAGTTWDTWARRANFGFENMERIRNGEAPQAVVKNFVTFGMRVTTCSMVGWVELTQ